MNIKTEVLTHITKKLESSGLLARPNSELICEYVYLCLINYESDRHYFNISGIQVFDVDSLDNK